MSVCLFPEAKKDQGEEGFPFALLLSTIAFELIVHE